MAIFKYDYVVYNLKCIKYIINCLLFYFITKKFLGQVDTIH